MDTETIALIKKIAHAQDELQKKVEALEVREVRRLPINPEITLFQVDFEGAPSPEQQEAATQFREELRRLCHDFRIVGFRGSYRRP